MPPKEPPNISSSDLVLEISKKINEASDIQSAIQTAAEEIGRVLCVDQIQIILHRPESES